MKRCARKRPRRSSKESKCAHPADLSVDMVVDYTTPGSAMDDQLRKEQARAVFRLLAARSARSDQQNDGEH